MTAAGTSLQVVSRKPIDRQRGNVYPAQVPTALLPGVITKIVDEFWGRRSCKQIASAYKACHYLVLEFICRDQHNQIKTLQMRIETLEAAIVRMRGEAA